MSNIELVIKIPEEIYIHFLSRYKYQDTNDTGLSDSEKAGVAIKNGTPLPKYGKLIDYYDAIELINNKADEENSNFTINDIEKFGALLREVNPIIEADKENKT